jgi:hypothetical protein
MDKNNGSPAQEAEATDLYSNNGHSSEEIRDLFRRGKYPY